MHFEGLVSWEIVLSIMIYIFLFVSLRRNLNKLG